MPTLLKVLGWLLLIPGALSLVMIPIAAFQGNGSAAAGLVFFAGMFGGPGGLLLRAGLARQRDTALQEQMIGFVRSRDAFSIDELAAHIRKPAGEAQQRLTADIARYHLPLVMHRASGRYLRLDRLAPSAQVAEFCQSCGGSLGNQIVFAGERLTCPYCGTLVVTHAPAPANWHPGQHPNQWSSP